MLSGRKIDRLYTKTQKSKSTGYIQRTQAVYIYSINKRRRRVHKGCPVQTSGQGHSLRLWPSRWCYILAGHVSPPALRSPLMLLLLLSADPIPPAAAQLFSFLLPRASSVWLLLLLLMLSPGRVTRSQAQISTSSYTPCAQQQQPTSRLHPRSYIFFSCRIFYLKRSLSLLLSYAVCVCVIGSHVSVL